MPRTSSHTCHLHQYKLMGWKAPVHLYPVFWLYDWSPKPEVSRAACPIMLTRDTVSRMHSFPKDLKADVTFCLEGMLVMLRVRRGGIQLKAAEHGADLSSG